MVYRSSRDLAVTSIKYLHRRDTYFDIGKPRDKEPEEEEAEYWEPSKVGCFIGSVVLGSMRGLGGFEDGGRWDSARFTTRFSLLHRFPTKIPTGPRTLDLSGVQFTPTIDIAFREQLGYALEARHRTPDTVLTKLTELFTRGLFLRCNNNNPRQKAPVVKEGLWGNVVGRFNKGNEGSDTESLRSESPSRITTFGIPLLNPSGNSAWPDRAVKGTEGTNRVAVGRERETRAVKGVQGKSIFVIASSGLDENYKIAGVTSSRWSHILPFAHDHRPAASSVLVVQWLQNQRKPNPAFPLVHWFFSPEICAPFESENLIMVIFASIPFPELSWKILPVSRALFTESVWSWNLSLKFVYDNIPDFFASSEGAEQDGEPAQIGMAIVGPLDVGGALRRPWSVVLHLFGSLQCIIRVKYMNISKQMLRKGTKGPSKGEKKLKTGKNGGRPRARQGPLPPLDALGNFYWASTIDSQASIGSLRSTASGWSRPDPSAHFILLSISVIYPISSTNPPSYPGVREEKPVGEGQVYADVSVGGGIGGLPT
ncbi:hypothetical protein C8J56DRAFT_896361 [Mycena floridula]|nr:hypothetical protein C8J56DRAFT_896361 [Mycena floridula]